MGRKLSPSSLKIGSKFLGLPAAPKTSVPPVAPCPPVVARCDCAQAERDNTATLAMPITASHRRRVLWVWIITRPRKFPIPHAVIADLNLSHPHRGYDPDTRNGSQAHPVRRLTPERAHAITPCGDQSGRGPGSARRRTPGRRPSAGRTP